MPGSPQAGTNTATLGQQFPNASGMGVLNSTAPSSPYGVPYQPITIPTPYGGQAVLTQNPYGLTTSSSSPGSPYGGGSGYAPYYPSIVPDLAGGYLRGVADVTMANAQYQVVIQQARIAQVQADMAKLDLRRRIHDEARYEQMMRPNPEQVRVAEMAVALNRARRDPPLTEIWSGQALNDLYRHLADLQSKGYRGPNVPIDEDLLKRLNVTTGTGGSVGLLKDGGELRWPLPLQGAEFAEAQKALSRNLANVVQQAKFGNPVDTATLKDTQADLRRLNETLSRMVGDMAPSQYIEAKRYLSHLEDAVKALQDPNVSNYFTQKWTAKGKTVSELIKNMSDQGLRFAPATPGDEFAYRVLQQRLAAYDSQMNLVATEDRK
jgi:hypothetical protein